MVYVKACSCFSPLQFERQSEREQTTALTEKLDEEWKAIQASLSLSKVGRGPSVCVCVWGEGGVAIVPKIVKFSQLT